MRMLTASTVARASVRVNVVFALDRTARVRDDHRAPMRTTLPCLALPLLLAACGGDAPSRSAQAAPAEAKASGDAKTSDAAEAPDAARASDAAKASGTKIPEPHATAGTARTWTFDDAIVGQTPAGFRLTEAGGTGTPATWAVVADPSAPSQPHAFGITLSRNTKKTYNLAIVEGTRYADVDLQVMVKASTGVLNQGGGPIWRVKDERNYYVARWDPVEDNVNLYLVQAGVRTALATVSLELDTESWHALRVVAEGSHIELFVDDQPVLAAEDTALPEAGMIGLWTKSDAATLFDDLSVAAP
jgi:hypothetical protein